MVRKLEVGNAQGFWGDQVDAPYRLVKQHSSLDFLTLDYLSEVSMSILAIQREEDASLGYARDFVSVVGSLVPLWREGSHVKVISNGGGLNPHGCALACSDLLRKQRCYGKKIGIVSGDNVLLDIKSNPTIPYFQNLETSESAEVISRSIETAHAYIGAKSIVQAIEMGADIVITGRVADPSLTVAPAVAHFGWRWDDYNRIAGATVAGHLIECGTQVTGGISTDWLEIPDPAEIGFPIVEIDEFGACVVTKPKGTSGTVNEKTVKEQLLYEIGDPSEYLSPDVRVSFLTLRVIDMGNDRVSVSGAEGRAPSGTYKVSATYQDGFRCEALLGVFGRNAELKARRCGEIILERMNLVGYTPQRSLIECIGAGDIVPGIGKKNSGQQASECIFRIAVADPRREVLERFSKEIAPLVTSGPQGITGYVSGRPHIRRVFGYWPCLIPTDWVHPKVEIMEVRAL